MATLKILPLNLKTCFALRRGKNKTQCVIYLNFLYTAVHPFLIHWGLIQDPQWCPKAQIVPKYTCVCLYAHTHNVFLMHTYILYFSYMSVTNIKIEVITIIA